MREPKSTNPELVQLIRFLKKQSREKEANIWLDVAEYLAKPRRQRVAVNLSRISRHTQRRDIVVVPGKVLGTGTL
ncbi:MAG TPA: 50S ribosomal protein L18e, partial [Candidatus Bathyarchaeia archaeon]